MMHEVFDTNSGVTHVGVDGEGLVHSGAMHGFQPHTRRLSSVDDGPMDDLPCLNGGVVTPAAGRGGGGAQGLARRLALCGVLARDVGYVPVGGNVE